MCRPPSGESLATPASYWEGGYSPECHPAHQALAFQASQHIPMFPGGSGVHPQRKCVRKQPLLFAGGPPAPALRGVDRRHRENLLQKSPPGGEGGERFLNLAFPLLLRDSIWGGGVTSILRKVLHFQGRKETEGEPFLCPEHLSVLGRIQCLILRGRI